MIKTDRIERLLKLYRNKLEFAQQPPIDYTKCIPCEAIIGILEDLYEESLGQDSE